MLCRQQLAAIMKRNVESKTRTRWSWRWCWGTQAVCSRRPPGCVIPAPPSPPAKGSSQAGLTRLRAASRSRSPLPQFYPGIPLFHPLRASLDASGLLPLSTMCKAAGSAVCYGIFCLYSSTFNIIKLYLFTFIPFHLPWQLQIPRAQPEGLPKTAEGRGEGRVPAVIPKLEQQRRPRTTDTLAVSGRLSRQ